MYCAYDSGMDVGINGARHIGTAVLRCLAPFAIHMHGTDKPFAFRKGSSGSSV